MTKRSLRKIDSKLFVQCLVAAIVGISGLASAAEDARDIMDRSDKAHRLPFEHTKSKMVLQEKDGPPRERVIESWAIDDDKNGDKSRMKFHAPADVQGTGVLTLESIKGGEDEQWLYLPAFKKTRRVGQSELGDRFVGTDFFYEDMKHRKIADYNFQILNSEALDGQDCWVIESVPSAPSVVKESPYGKSHMWVRKDNLMVVRVRYFSKKMEPLKQLDVAKLVAVTKTAWRADEVTMVDIKRKHRTKVTVTERQISDIPADVFTTRQLESE